MYYSYCLLYTDTVLFKYGCHCHCPVMEKSSKSIFHLCETDLLAHQNNLLDFEGISITRVSFVIG